ncbi:putative transmembrane protein [Rosellinia necatrix]|uniref:Putative transmembrane protein n=1 Tax=Rosellinia necatrix TaxID=77044 RepID=A0A1W2TFG5_ROSNE|nr:putative transmembrane protein [Rosellinia necatrix]
MTMASSIQPLVTDTGMREWFGSAAQSIQDWLSQPHVFAIVITWAVTFTLICSLVLCLGFGPVGVGAGTLAAAFQSAMYGGFTPAGGIFATLTSMAMLGTLMPVAAIIAALIATMAAGIAWGYGAGR